MINSGEIVEVFNSEFGSAFATVLEGGGDEPVYLPKEGAMPARIVFKEDFAASALHEVAHWCLAGEKRRRLVDYGYWYESERDECAQQRFESVEVAPQSLEWIFSTAAARPFRVSCDNFDREDHSAFCEAVRRAAIARMDRGLPPRAKRFAEALAKVSGSRMYLARCLYEELPQ